MASLDFLEGLLDDVGSVVEVEEEDEVGQVHEELGSNERRLLTWRVG